MSTHTRTRGSLSPPYRARRQPDSAAADRLEDLAGPTAPVAALTVHAAGAAAAVADVGRGVRGVGRHLVARCHVWRSLHAVTDTHFWRLAAPHRAADPRRFSSSAAWPRSPTRWSPCTRSSSAAARSPPGRTTQGAYLVWSATEPEQGVVVEIF